MFRQRKYLFAVAALVLVFAGCKGESPTSPTTNPPTTTIGGGGGGTPPPTTATITLAVSNPTPQVNSSSIITATVTDANNQPAANGTAVEFDTNLGTFTEANAQTVIRTTTNGVATVTLTSALAGTATVSAIVANVKKTATVTFSTVPITPPPPDTTPVITGISPNFGAPTGGQVVTITGKNFRTPLRVLFDFGPGKSPKDATIITSTGTSIQVLTPSVDLGPTAQQVTATIKVINEAGTPNEIVVTGPTFTYQLTILTPKITTVSPASGPIDGGTRVTIYGEGFQAPVQIFFGAAEVQPIQVLFNQITVMSPTARDATPDASGTGTGSVDVRVINITSATQDTLKAAFRFVPKMAITAMGPTQGSFTGGTRVRIDGTGFNDPVAVVIGGIAAQPISVSGTEIVAITGAPVVTGCGDISGATSVTNVNNGDTASGPNFTFQVPKPIVVSATNGVVGGSTSIVVSGAAVGVPRLTIGDQPLAITNSSTDAATGLTTFTATIPITASTLLNTQSCPAGGAVPIPTFVNVTYTNLTTTCTATLTKGLLLSPAPTPAVTLIPLTFSPFTSVIANPSATPPTTGTPSAPQTLNIVNTGPVPVRVNNVATSGCGNFSFSGTPFPTTLNSCDAFQITAQYNRTATQGSDSCVVTVTFVDSSSNPLPSLTKVLILNGTASP
ncbi:MAG TPA: IPT/TIG domain-containing protein [Thermoanaerobaculia bacterium]|nr:IPT/TIG domain-containing protein [Thermoanaerobaculia bacterium]